MLQKAKETQPRQVYITGNFSDGDLFTIISRLFEIKKQLRDLTAALVQRRSRQQ